MGTCLLTYRLVQQTVGVTDSGRCGGVPAGRCQVLLAGARGMSVWGLVCDRGGKCLVVVLR